MNGSIQPTVELATTNGATAYPVFYGNNGGFGNGGFFGGEGIWAILLFAMIFGNGGWGNNNGGFFGGRGFDDGYAWLSNGQKEIMQNTNQGFDTLHLSNQIEGTRDGIYGLSNQLCNVGNDITSAINTTAYNAEIAAANRQMANMNTAFDLSRQFADCCCENRLGIANLNSTILSENCADRAALADGLKDVLINQTANTQRILDQLCNDKIDAKNEKIAELQRELSMKDLQASQIAQNAFISKGFADEVDALYNRLSNCPVPSTPVYGRTPIFTCPNNNNYGCGCGGNFSGNFI